MTARDLGLLSSINCHSIHSACLKGDRAQLKLLISSQNSSQNSALEVKDYTGKTPLIYAVISNHVECLHLLLKAGARVDNADNSGQTALHWAAYKGHTQCAKALLDKGAVWYQMDVDGMTPLHLAARNKSPKCLQLFLQSDNEHRTYDIWDSSKKTALHWSASVANYEHVKLLLKKDANVNIPDVDGRTPLHWAAASNSPKALDCVKLLLASSPSILEWQDYHGKTALHLAVIMGTHEVIDALTLSQKSLDLQDNMFRTPLHWAALLGLSPTCGLLLDRGANFAACDANKARPLHYAAKGNFAETVSTFLSRSYICDKADSYGCTALLWAASKGADHVLEVMKQHGVDLKTSDKNLNTALHAASLQGHSSTVQWLIEQGCSVSVENSCGQTPLLLACHMGRAKVLRILLNKGISTLHAVDADGRTALHCAVISGHAYICQILLQYGINPNIQDSYGLSPLHYASYIGNLNCMSVLLEKGANPNCADNLGQTTVHWACLRGRLEAVKLLLAFGAQLNSMAWNTERNTPLDYALQSGHNGLLDFLCERDAVSSVVILNLAAIVIQTFMKNFCTSSGNKRIEIKLNPAQVSKWICPSTNVPTRKVNCHLPVTPQMEQLHRNSAPTVKRPLKSRIPVFAGSLLNLTAKHKLNLPVSSIIYVPKIDIPVLASPIDIRGFCLGCHTDVIIKTPVKRLQRETMSPCFGVISPKTTNLRTMAAIVIQRMWRRYFWRKRNRPSK